MCNSYECKINFMGESMVLYAYPFSKPRNKPRKDSLQRLASSFRYSHAFDAWTGKKGCPFQSDSGKFGCTSRGRQRASGPGIASGSDGWNATPARRPQICAGDPCQFHLTHQLVAKESFSDSEKREEIKWVKGGSQKTNNTHIKTLWRHN